MQASSHPEQKTSMPAPAFHAGVTNRRNKNRLKLVKELASVCGLGGAPGRALDISANGLQVETQRPLARGQRLQIFFGRGAMLESCDGLWAVVMWQAGSRAGLRFLEADKAERCFGRVYRRWLESSEPGHVMSWIDGLFTAR